MRSRGVQRNTTTQHTDGPRGFFSRPILIFRGAVVGDAKANENSSSSVVLLPLAPVSLIVQLFDAFLAFSLLFGSFLLYVQEGSAASIQGDMQIEAAARLKSTLSDLPDLDISRNISFGAPRAY